MGYFLSDLQQYLHGIFSGNPLSCWTDLDFTSLCEFYRKFGQEDNDCHKSPVKKIFGTWSPSGSGIRSCLINSRQVGSNPPGATNVIKMNRKECILLVERLFSNKFDLGGNPYIEHLNRVARTFHYDEDLYIIAIMHDILEDTDLTVEELSGYVNNRCLTAIIALTRVKNENYSDYITRVKNNEDARQIKEKDLLDNMDITRLKELGEKDFKRLVKYHKAFRELLV